MKLRCLLVFLALVCYSNGQTTPPTTKKVGLEDVEDDTTESTTDAIFVTTPLDVDEEGCQGEEKEEHVFETMELVPILRCQQLNRYECMAFHEAKEACPCVCRLRKYYYNPEGIRRGQDLEAEYDPFQDVNPHDGRIRAQKRKEEPPPPPRPPAATGPIGPPAFLCFHGNGTVITDQGVMRMANLLQTPDAKVLAWDSENNNAILSRIRFWLHAHPEQPATFLRLTTEKGKQLLITENHVIYKSAQCQGLVHSVTAGQVEEGDCLVVKEGKKIEKQKVESIDKEELTGIYAPVTEEGTIIVDDVAASCYAQNDNIFIQKIISKYSSWWFDILRFVFPEVRSYSEVQVPSIYLAFERLQKYFL